MHSFLLVAFFFSCYFTLLCTAFTMIREEFIVLIDVRLLNVISAAVFGGFLLTVVGVRFKTVE